MFKDVYCRLVDESTTLKTGWISELQLSNGIYAAIKSDVCRRILNGYGKVFILY